MGEDRLGTIGDLAGLLAFAPPWLLGLLLLLAAAAVALLLHAVLIRVVRPFAREGRGFVPQFLRRMRGPSRFALVIASIAVAVPAAPFDPATRESIAQVLLLAFVLLAGWIAFIALDVAADVYLSRFTVEASDDLIARKSRTQVTILKRAVQTLIVIVTIAAGLMSFDIVRYYGVSLFASAGAAGLVVGLAARPVLSNLIAGIQIALTQPIRIGDSVLVEGEYGTVEEIGSAFVLLRLWDMRRLIVPVSYFIEKPFQNWTRQSTALVGSVYWSVDYSVPVDRVRSKLQELVRASPLWDGNIAALQVTDATSEGVQLRALVSAANPGQTWDLRCEVREKMIAWMNQEHPGALPHRRTEIIGGALHVARDLDDG